MTASTKAGTPSWRIRQLTIRGGVPQARNPNAVSSGRPPDHAVNDMRRESAEQQADDGEHCRGADQRDDKNEDQTACGQHSGRKHRNDEREE